MKTLHYFILLFLFLTPHINAQDSDDEVLMTIHDRKVTVNEFERIYNKNNSNTALEQQTVEEYLDLFINFKLKVIEAEELGMDTLESFIREFTGYRKQLAKPYLSDQEEVDMLVKQAFERAQKELYAGHVLIRLNEFAGPEDTTAAYTKAMEIRQRIISGEDFGTVAKAYSDDPSAKNNAGVLGWFTVFRMVYPFENGAYNTPKGEVSLPVRTRFGYHVIKVLDERPARGEIQVSHIMVMVPESMTEEQKLEAKEKIHQYYDSLQAGNDFAEMARKYSEDRGSAGNGGTLPWFGTGRMVAPFEQASFTIENIGEYSEPVQTSFGWHIIQLNARKTYDDFESAKADLQANVTKSDRNTYSKTAMIKRIKNKNNFTELRGNLAEFYSVVDTNIFDRTWDPGKASGLDATLFTIGDRDVSQKEFTSYLATHQGGTKMNIEVFVDKQYGTFVEEQVLKYEEDQLPEKFPEFRYLVQEYHDGILLFDLTDKMVWSKAVEDSAGLDAFYREHKGDYQWEKRMDASVYICRDEEVANFAIEMLGQTKKRKKLGTEAIQAKAWAEFSDSSCLVVEDKKFEAGDHSLADQMDWSKDKISSTQAEDDKVVFIVNKKVLKPSAKDLENCKGLVTADYQNYLEKQWIETLRAKYPVKVNEELLSKIK